MTIDELIAHGEAILPCFMGKTEEYIKATLEILKAMRAKEKEEE